MDGGNKSGDNNAQIRRIDNKIYKFYFVKPPENSNADHLAEQLISMKGVEEVFVTDGDYGFIVKTRFFDGMKSDGVHNYISKRLGSDFGRVTSYYQYKK
jgi:hypothetical protein